jgi:hypothetical protein
MVAGRAATPKGERALENPKHECRAEKSEARMPKECPNDLSPKEEPLHFVLLAS